MPWTVSLVLCCMPCPEPYVLTTSPLNRRWDFIMYRAMDTASPFAVFYFLLVLIIGTYLLVSGGTVVPGYVLPKLVCPAIALSYIYSTAPYFQPKLFIIYNETPSPLL